MPREAAVSRDVPRRRERERIASTCSDLPARPLTKLRWKPASKGFLEMQAAGVIFLGQRGQSRTLVVVGGQGHKWRITGTSGEGLVNERETGGYWPLC